MDSLDVNDIDILARDFVNYKDNPKNIDLQHTDHLPVKFSLISNHLKI